MDNLHTVNKKYEVQYAGDVLLNEHDVAILRFDPLVMRRFPS